MEQELLQLEARVSELKAWKEAFTKKRFNFPLDYKTKEIFNKENLIFTGKKYTVNYDIILTDYINFGMVVDIKNNTEGLLNRTLVASFPLFEVTVNATTNVFTYPKGSNQVANDDTVSFTTTNTLPAPLASTPYYVINATSNTFKVSLTQGGAEIDISDVGVGTHYFA